MTTPDRQERVWKVAGDVLCTLIAKTPIAVIPSDHPNRHTMAEALACGAVDHAIALDAEFHRRTQHEAKGEPTTANWRDTAAPVAAPAADGGCELPRCERVAAGLSFRKCLACGIEREKFSAAIRTDRERLLAEVERRIERGWNLELGTPYAASDIIKQLRAEALA